MKTYLTIGIALWAMPALADQPTCDQRKQLADYQHQINQQYQVIELLNQRLRAMGVAVAAPPAMPTTIIPPPKGDQEDCPS